MIVRKEDFACYKFQRDFENKDTANPFQRHRKPETFHSDKGTEFTNRKFQALLKKEGIRFFTTQNETKASIVERFNRTLKGKMWKYFTANNTLKYMDILQKLVKSYNHSRHRSIGMRPVDVNETNESIVWQKLYGEEPEKPVRFKFDIGDQVRINKTRRTFKKGYLPIKLDRRSVYRNETRTSAATCVHNC
jgi:hypothetical protein